MTFQDKHAIITGGSSGIGLATTRLLAERGARVSVIALDDAYMEALTAAPPDSPHGIEAVAADVGDSRQVASALSACSTRHGPCDILITCAGVGRPGYFAGVDEDEFVTHMRVNYFGTLWAVRAVVPSMAARGAGVIMCVASAAALFGVFGYAAYAPSKHAVRGLCETLRTELRPDGIHVGCVFPSDVDTPMLEAEEPLKPPELRAISGTVQPIPAEQVADAILEGIVDRRPTVFPDRKTRVLARVAALTPGLTRHYMDWQVRRTRKNGPGRA